LIKITTCEWFCRKFFIKNYAVFKKSYKKNEIYDEIKILSTEDNRRLMFNKAKQLHNKDTAANGIVIAPSQNQLSVDDFSYYATAYLMI